MLFAIVSTWSCWAFMPEAAVISARIMVSLRFLGSALLVQALVRLVDAAQDVRRGLEAALDADHRDQLLDALGVRALARSLMDERRGGTRLGAVRRDPAALRVTRQALDVREVDDLQPSELVRS